MTFIEQSDSMVLGPRTRRARLARAAAAEIRLLTEEMDRQIAIRDEKIGRLQIKVEELYEIISMLR